MQWKNITLENGFVKQEMQILNTKTTNYIPLEHVDSFGVVSSENKRWLYAAAFFALLAFGAAFGNDKQPMAFMAMTSIALFAYYYFTRKTWFSICSQQSKFQVQVTSKPEEMKLINEFIEHIKKSVQHNNSENQKLAA
jgi:hypothetical protein